MLEYVVILGLLLAAGYWILSPLLKPDQFKSTPMSKVHETLRHLEIQKENAYAAIRELEFDFSMGKLSEADFNTLKAQYRADAVHLLREIDALGSDDQTDDLPMEANSEADNGAHPVVCGHCGTKISDPGLFCYSCGERLVSVS